jgi:hypothetical protein
MDDFNLDSGDGILHLALVLSSMLAMQAERGSRSAFSL